MSEYSARTYRTEIDGLIVRRVDPKSYTKNGVTPRIRFPWIVIHRGTGSFVGTFEKREQALSFVRDLKGLADFSKPTYTDGATPAICEVLRRHNQWTGFLKR